MEKLKNNYGRMVKELVEKLIEFSNLNRKNL